MKSITFNYHRIKFRIANGNKIKAWLFRMAKNQRKNNISINYIFCSDAHLLKINRQFLNHDFFTDIITFDYSQELNSGISYSNISGDIYISIDRVKDNSKEFKISFDDELKRVIIHGLLHLCGYKDKTPGDQKNMRRLEDLCLADADTNR